MGETGSATDFLPERLSLAALRGAARGCTACPLWRTGTQTVFGEGFKRASLMLVGLGATAAQALLGREVRVTRDRGRPLASTLAPVALATVHPSSILRAPDRETRLREQTLLVEDLRVAAAALRG